MKCLAQALPIWAFLILGILASAPCSAAEQVADGMPNRSAAVLEYPDYNSLKGAELIKMVQLVLKNSGFDPGPIDGALGPKTREAIRKFQLAKELAPTGEPDRQTLDRLFW